MSSGKEDHFEAMQRLILPGALVLALLMWAVASLLPGRVAAAEQDTKSPAVASASSADTRETSGYVGSKACAACHKRIYDEFSATHMGRSLTPVTAQLQATLPGPASIYEENLKRHFDVFFRDGKLYQSEFDIRSDGQEVFRDTRQVEWIIGAGANGFGGLVRRDHYLFQAPLSFYSRANNWAPSPGYEFGDYGFNRPILPGCISCHSGQPKPVEGTNGRFEDNPFKEMSIGCENCHGPGALHIQAMNAGSAHPAAEGHGIVNPAHLTPALANNICMSCHQTGDIRILKPGKDYRDFRPGTPLDNTLSIMMVPPTPQAPPQKDHLEHYYSMTLSKCFRASAGQMKCISCHDPHIEPTGEQSKVFFKKRCLTCHTEASCGLPLEKRQKEASADDCIGCHMPRRDVKTILHASITNHRILARPNEPFPDVTFQQTTAALPDLIHLNPAPGEKDDYIPLLTLLQAYGELAETKPEYVQRYLTVLTQLERSEPGSGLVQAALGRRDLRAGSYQEAATHLQQAIAIDSSLATAFADLSDALFKMDRDQEALPLLQKAIALDAFNPVLQKTIVLRFIQIKQYAEAKAAMKHYLEVFPQDSFMRQMLARAEEGASPK